MDILKQKKVQIMNMIDPTSIKKDLGFESEDPVSRVNQSNLRHVNYSMP